jgi:uncharacterized membrane protein HdeD (DUF308 family)
MTYPASTSRAVQAVVAENRTWFMLLGLLLVLLGLAAIAFPFVTTIAAKTFLGWLFLIAGIVQIVHAFSTQKWSQFFLNVLIGAIYIIAGGWLAFFPLTGIIALTAFLAGMFVVQGVIEFSMAFRMRPQAGWVWMLISGIIAVVAGFLIFQRLPSSAVWAIGLLVGVNMVSSGFAYLFLALGAGKES